VLYTQPFNGPLSGTTRVSRYQKGKTNLYFTEARDSEWQWHQLRHMQDCTSLQSDNHASTPPLIFLQVGCPSCRPTNSDKAMKHCLLLVLYTHTCLTAFFSGTTQVSRYQKVLYIRGRWKCETWTCGTWKCGTMLQGWKMRDMNLRHQLARVDMTEYCKLMDNLN